MTCPYKFKLRYIDAVFWNHGRSQANALARRGQEFHLISQRYFLGISNLLLSPEMKMWLEELKKFVPIIDDLSYYPEEESRLNDDGLRLLAKYDLLHINENGKIIIYDWKTDPKPLARVNLSESVQTKLYMYLVCAAGEGVLGFNPKPQNISFIYWNPQFPDKRETFTYDQTSFEKDEKWIKNIIHEILEKDKKDYYKTTNKHSCTYCEYIALCQGKRVIFVSDEIDDKEYDQDKWDDTPELLY